MTAPNTTTAPIVKPVAIVYECKASYGKAARVTVTQSERGDSLYECGCGAFTLYGQCQHTQAVQAERQAQGRK